MTFLDRLNSQKFDFSQNQSGGKIIKFQQSQALSSRFESFCSIVLWIKLILFYDNEFSAIIQNASLQILIFI